METSIVPSTSTTLSNSLFGIEERLEQAARENLALVQGDFTEIEKRAMLVVEELHLVNGFDLAALLMRGKLIKQIREEALFSVHPNEFQTLEQAAQSVGISQSELSNIIDLTEVIFPYLTNTLGLNVALVWEDVGKSNFRELVPVLKGLITGVNPASQSTQDAIQRILDDVIATGQISNQTLTPEQVVAQAVSNLVELGGQQTNRELRQTLRPGHTDPIPTTVLYDDNANKRIVLVEMDEDQWLAFQRTAGRSLDMDFHTYDRTQRSVARIPHVREVFPFLGGE